MRKTAILSALLISSFITFAQWRYKKVADPFNGGYEIATVNGFGDFPYNNPVLAVRTRDNDPNGDARLQIMVLNVNYGSNYDDLKISVVFNGETEATSYLANTNSAGDLWFFNSTIETKKEFIEKLKSKNSLIIRLSTSYGYEDYAFPLRGSTAAINKLKLI